MPSTESGCAENRKAPSGAEESRSLLRGAGVFALLTAACRATGVVRQLAISSLLPAAVRDAFLLAFTVPNLFRNLFGEGALTSGFVPVYVERIEKGDREGADRLAGMVASNLAVGLGLLAVLGVLTSVAWRSLALDPGEGLTLRLLEVMLPFLPLVCLYALFMAMLTSHRRFAAPGAAPILLNLSMIAGVILAWIYRRDDPQAMALILSVSVVVGGVLQLGLQMPWAKSCGIRLRFRLGFSDSGMREIAVRMGPVLVGASAYEICVLANRLLARSFCGEGAVSYLSNSNILVAAPMGVVAVAAGTAALPVLSSLHARGDREGFQTALLDAARMGMFLLAPSAVVFMFGGEAIVRLLFERGRWLPEETVPMSRVLFWYSAGLVPIVPVMLGARAFYAMKRYWIPATVAVITVVLNLLVGSLLVWSPNSAFAVIGRACARWGGETWVRTWFGGSAGLAFATCLAGWVQAGLMLVVLRRVHSDLRLELLAASFARICGVAAASALVVNWVMTSLPPDGEGQMIVIQRGVAPAILGLLAYWLAASLADVPEYRELCSLLRRKKRGGGEGDDGDDDDDEAEKPGPLLRLWRFIRARLFGAPDAA
jgi:putative peptidoglycan lipid II flippase